jgi:hypothetical protein
VIFIFQRRSRRRRRGGEGEGEAGGASYHYIITVSDQKTVEINVRSILSLHNFKFVTDREIVPLYQVLRN